MEDPKPRKNEAVGGDFGGNKGFERLLQIPGNTAYNTYAESQMLAQKIFDMTIGFHIWLTFELQRSRR